MPVNTCTAPGRVGIGCLADRADAVATVAAWLHRQWYRELGLSSTAAVETVLSRLNRERLPLALVASAGADVVGTVSLVAAGDVARLVGLYVLPAWRRQGVGSALCERAAEKAWSFGASRLLLETPNAATFYARLGWTWTADTVVEQGDGLQMAVVMQRRRP